MTPTRMAVMDASAQPIHRLEAQAGASYGTHFTYRADDQTLIQSIGDGEHLINAGSFLSETRPSIFATENEQAIESGYRHQESGAIIDSRALVTKDVAPYTIVGGNPAKVIKQRFSDTQITMLLEMAWWDWSLDDIKAAMPLLCASNIERLYDDWRARQS